MQMKLPPIVSPQEWDAARQELLVKEKALTRARDALAAERRRMPRMAVDREYEFEGPGGPARLLDLFAGRRQLIVYRFFFEPGVHGWPDGGCPGCSWIADQVTHPAHLNARDTTLVFVSRAPQADIERWKARMGWEAIPWYTLTDDFDADFDVDLWRRHQRVHPGRRPDLPQLLRRRPRRRDAGRPLELPRHHRARASGGVGGLARGLPADAAQPVDAAPRRVRRAGRVGGGQRERHGRADRPLPLRPARLTGFGVSVRLRERGPGAHAGAFGHGTTASVLRWLPSANRSRRRNRRPSAPQRSGRVTPPGR